MICLVSNCFEWFPASGNRNRTSGTLNNVSGNGNYWLASSNSQSNSYNLNFNSGNVNPQNNNERAYGFSVCPVAQQELIKSISFLRCDYNRRPIG